MESEARGQKRMTMLRASSSFSKVEGRPVSMAEPENVETGRLHPRGAGKESTSVTVGGVFLVAAPPLRRGVDAATDHKWAWLCSNKTIGH